MNEFFRFFKKQPSLVMNIICESHEGVDIKITSINGAKEVVFEGSSFDIDLCFAKAQVAVKQWLLDTYGKYNM